jgi:hypothetical protein
VFRLELELASRSELTSVSECRRALALQSE